MAFLGDLDRAALQWVNGFVGVHPGMDNAVRFVAEWNFGRSFWLGCFLIWAWFRLTHRDTRLKIVSGMTGLLIATVISRTVQIMVPVHSRPFNFIAELSLHVPRHLDTHWGAVSSFPSDTATLYFALAAIIFSVSRAWGVAAFAWVALVIALPRVYILYHWPSDILGGLILGAGGVFMAQRLRDTVPQFSAIITIEKLEPGLFYPVMFVLLFQIIDSFNAVELTIGRVAALATGAHTHASVEAATERQPQPWEEKLSKVAHQQ